MNHKLDLRGLDCPMPLIKTKKKLEEISIGDVLEITSNTPLYYEDVVLLCKKTGDRLVSRSTIGPTTAIITIEKQ
jgi:tRNA 2-thiouridine synthesizing protein A